MLSTIDTAFKHHKYYRIFLKWTPEIKKFKEEKGKKIDIFLSMHMPYINSVNN